MSIDYSTISLNYLAGYPVIDGRDERYVRKHMGMGCALDAPGYPSYFVQSIEYPYEDSADALVIRHPRTGRYHIICKMGDSYEYRGEQYRSLYIPVKQDSLRFLLWEQHCYLHWYGCQYREQPDRNGSHAHCGVDFRRLAWAWLRSADNSEESQDLYAQLLSHFAAWHIRQTYPEYTWDLDKVVYTPRNPQSASGAVIPSLSKEHLYKGEYYTFEINNRWWERHASRREVGIDGLEKFPSTCEGW